jgi:hypothetical protein
MSALCEGVDCRQIGALCIISLNIRMTGDTQPPPPARARRVAEGLLPLYMSIRSKRPTGSGVRRRLARKLILLDIDLDKYMMCYCFQIFILSLKF